MSLFESIDKSMGMVHTLDYLDVDYRPWHTGWQQIHCPFTMNHKNNDRNASASVNLDIGAFTCHACGAKGDWARILYDLVGMPIDKATKLLGLETSEDHDPTEGGIFLF